MLLTPLQLGPAMFEVGYLRDSARTTRYDTRPHSSLPKFGAAEADQGRDLFTPTKHSAWWEEPDASPATVESGVSFGRRELWTSPDYRARPDHPGRVGRDLEPDPRRRLAFQDGTGPSQDPAQPASSRPKGGSRIGSAAGPLKTGSSSASCSSPGISRREAHLETGQGLASTSAGGGDAANDPAATRQATPPAPAASSTGAPSSAVKPQEMPAAKGKGKGKEHAAPPAKAPSLQDALAGKAAALTPPAQTQPAAEPGGKAGAVAAAAPHKAASKGKGKGSPPPPPPPHRAKAAGPRGRKAEDKWFSGRRMHWKEVAGGEARGSVFDQDLAGKAIFDWEEWERLFRPTEAQAKATARRKSSIGNAEPETTVLSHHQANMAGVVLLKCGDLPKLCDALASLQPISEEEVDRLNQLLDMVEAPREQLLKLGQATGGALGPEQPPLRDMERKLIPLVQVDRARQRVQLARIAFCHEDKRKRVAHDMQQLTSAASEALKSDALKELLWSAMTLYRCLQYGPEVALQLQGEDALPPKAMDISSLMTSMKDYKVQNPDADVRQSKNLLHFFAHAIYRQNPNFDLLLADQLPAVAHFANTQPSWAGFIGNVNSLEADARFAKSELEHVAGYGKLEVQQRLRDIEEAARASAAEAREAQNSTHKALADLGRYFGRRTDSSGPGTKEPPGLDVLLQVDALRKSFKEAMDEVRGWRHEEKKADGGEPSSRSASTSRSNSTSPAPSELRSRSSSFLGR